MKAAEALKKQLMEEETKPPLKFPFRVYFKDDVQKRAWALCIGRSVGGRTAPFKFECSDGQIATGFVQLAQCLDVKPKSQLNFARELLAETSHEKYEPFESAVKRLVETPSTQMRESRLQEVNRERVPAVGEKRERRQVVHPEESLLVRRNVPLPAPLPAQLRVAPSPPPRPPERDAAALAWQQGSETIGSFLTRLVKAGEGLDHLERLRREAVNAMKIAELSLHRFVVDAQLILPVRIKPDQTVDEFVSSVEDRLVPTRAIFLALFKQRAEEMEEELNVDVDTETKADEELLEYCGAGSVW